MKMKWSKLLAQERLGAPVKVVKLTEEKYPRSEFEKDYMRILNCASFRRLQDKTQVFPLDKSDFVRTRLTHSYETSAIAKTLGVMIRSQILKKDLDQADQEAIANIPEVLACAGLVHDVGNPPFGHFGEKIIQNWFKANLKMLNVKKVGSKESPLAISKILGNLEKDFEHFDGNAQALRVLTKLHFHDSDQGLNLTAPILGTLIKYPTFSNQIKIDSDISRKKMGLFSSEWEIYQNIVKITGAEGCRHPLTYILEAADDIAYKTADIEDGLKKGLYNVEQLISFASQKIVECEEKGVNIYFSRELFGELKKLQEGLPPGIVEKKVTDKDLFAIQNWIPYVRECLMYVAVYRFTDKKYYADIMDGSNQYDLFHETHHEKSVEIFYDVLKEFVFSNREILKLELAASTILTGLLDRLVPAVLFHDKKYVSEKHVEQASYEKLYQLLSENYIESYRIAPEKFQEKTDNPSSLIRYDIYHRLMLAVDYVSGMTDSFAKSLYQELMGI